MRYQCTLEGLTPLILHNGAAGLADTNPNKLAIAEITKKKASDRTDDDRRELVRLECLNGLYVEQDRIVVPASAIRRAIEQAARKTKHGGRVREGLIIESWGPLAYDEDRYGATPAEVSIKAQYTVPVVVQRQRVNRTRPRFGLPWSLPLTVDVEPDLIDEPSLDKWLHVAGARIGIGDWRPERSGDNGRFRPINLRAL